MRLINADALIWKLHRRLPQVKTIPLWILDAILGEPTIDAVPVVRCKDCKYSRKDELWGMRWCKGLTVKDEHFCADGERKDNE